MNFKPIGDRVIVKRLETENKVGQIITLSPEPSQFFEIIAISEEITNPSISKGNIVLIPKYGFNTFENENQTYGIIKLEDILAVKS